MRIMMNGGHNVGTSGGVNRRGQCCQALLWRRIWITANVYLAPACFPLDDMVVCWRAACHGLFVLETRCAKCVLHAGRVLVTLATARLFSRRTCRAGIFRSWWPRDDGQRRAMGPDGTIRT